MSTPLTAHSTAPADDTADDTPWIRTVDETADDTASRGRGSGSCGAAGATLLRTHLSKPQQRPLVHGPRACVLPCSQASVRACALLGDVVAQCVCAYVMVEGRVPKRGLFVFHVG